MKSRADLRSTASHPKSPTRRRLWPGFIALMITGAAIVNSGCKLVELKMPGEPMAKEDFALRTQTREFANILSATVQRAADEIARDSEDPEIRTRSMQWKIGAASTIRSATLRSSPTLAIVDSWAFCRQMNQFFENGAGTNLFGSHQALAVTQSQALETRLAKIARTWVPSSQLSKMETFLTEYVSSFPLRTISFEREPVAARWEDFQGKPVSIVPAGTTSEALSDFSDRLQMLGQQVPEEVRWRLTLESEEMERGLARTGVTLDRLDEAMKRIGDAATASPTTISNAVNELRVGFLPVLERLQSQWGTTITTLQQERQALALNIASERAEVMKGVDHQRAAIMKETQEITRDVIERSMNQVRALVRDVLFYAVILVALILGLPFVIGLFLGRAWGRGMLVEKPATTEVISPQRT